LHPLADQICTLCARPSDLHDYELCSRCCHALAQAQETPEFPDWLDNCVGWLCRRAGVGTLPILFVMAEEVALSHLMHHYVFLPTPIGIEIAEFSKKALASLNMHLPLSTMGKIPLHTFKSKEAFKPGQT
jgi:hypothetical protein